MSPPPKLIYFAERHPDLTPAGFVARWRQHSRLGMSLPRWRNIARYTQCDTIALPASPLPQLACDGVALVVYRSEAARLAHLADRAGSAVMKADERATFARPVADFALLTEAVPLVPERPAANCKLFLQVRLAGAVSGAAFRAAWQFEAGPRIARALAAAGPGHGYQQNHARALPDAAAPLCDCVDEIDCDDAAGVARLLAPLLGELRDLATASLVATRPTELYRAES